MSRRSKNTVPKIVMEREQAIAALERRRTWAQRLDVKNINTHGRAEQTTLNDFKKRCRAALKWTYEQLREHRFEIEVPYGGRPDCPALVETQLDEQLAILKLDTRKTLTITEDNENLQIFWLLTYDERAKAKAC